MKYQHFTVEEREKIQEMLWQKSSIRNIAKTLGRNPSSISKEIKRNLPPIIRRYTPRIAHMRALEYRRHRGKRKLETNEKLQNYVVSRIKIGWSPEQIAATSKNTIALGKEDLMKILTVLFEDFYRKTPISGQYPTRRYIKSNIFSIPDQEKDLAGRHLMRYSMN